ncbi:MAG: hypothetical protein KGM47_03455 [Acidobacteriota bacterium]|nr:hypothetical protein [Acidobacteriota bacterium]
MSDRIFRKFRKSRGHWYAARQVQIKVHEGKYDTNKNGILDVVEYDRQKMVFKIVELKAGHSDATVCEAFKQVTRYSEKLKGRADIFVDAFTRKSPMRFARVMEATSGGTEINVEFYVGLTDKACKNINRLHSLKGKYPAIGIIRVKVDGTLKHDIKTPDGKHDQDLARAQVALFVLTRPPVPKNLNNAAPTSGAAA